jgi:Tetrahydrofolate dehydrogenase/cyclohydrolase, NAD(P)-binding domain
VPIAGQHAVVIGRSAMLGKPAAMLLLGCKVPSRYGDLELPYVVAIANRAGVVGQPIR